MAKQQTFGDKAKGKVKSTHVNVKFIKTVKGENGAYKFQEKFVKQICIFLNKSVLIS